MDNNNNNKKNDIYILQLGIKKHKKNKTYKPLWGQYN